MSKEEHSGGQVNYYLVEVRRPRRSDQPAYQAECEDIIAALGMTFDEGCAFKAIWRSAAARNSGPRKKGHDPIYDAQKVQHYGKQMEHEARGKMEALNWVSISTGFNKETENGE